jgi:hypothetical protein
MPPVIHQRSQAFAAVFSFLVGSCGGVVRSTADASVIDESDANGFGDDANGSPTCSTVCDAGCTFIASDPSNCGRCRHDCLGGICNAGRCQPVMLAGGLGTPAGIAVDGTNVYVSDTVQGLVERIPVSGGPVQRLATNQPSPFQIAVDSSHVYWANQATEGTVNGIPGTINGSIAAANLDGAAPFAIASDLSSSPVILTLAEANVYWSAADGIHTCPLTGCAGSSSLLQTPARDPFGLAVDGPDLYWTDGHDLRVCALHACSTSSLLSTNLGGPDELIANGGGLYWLDPLDGTLNACVATNCMPTYTTLFVDHAATPLQITSDATNLYWTESISQGAVVACPLAGCPNTGPTVLASGQDHPVGVAVDQVAVYWANNGSGTVMRVAK